VIILSQNLSNHNFTVPSDAIFRINLAWCDSIEEFETILNRHTTNFVFVDLPVKRVKPPNNKYSLEDLIPIIKSHNQIRYFAVSNVESSDDLTKYNELLPNNVIIVPKIESPLAVSNIENIVAALKGPEKIVMLDHDDLFSSLLKNNESESKFKEYIKILVTFCEKNNIKLLRTIGVVFSDTEKRISQYIK